MLPDIVDSTQDTFIVRLGVTVTNANDSRGEGEKKEMSWEGNT
jgi:hypothetical protein